MEKGVERAFEILIRNAIGFYGLDADKLASIAGRIGPEKGSFNEIPK